MTEYELIDAMHSTMGSMMTSQGLFLSALFAYLVAAYTVGTKLTQFQAAFISVTFIVFALGGTSAVAAMSIEVSYLQSAIGDVRGSHSASGSFPKVVGTMLVLVRPLVTIGALYFMWQVRHPKTE